MSQDVDQARALRSLRRILPAADFGTASMNSTSRTFLCGATRSADVRHDRLAR